MIKKLGTRKRSRVALHDESLVGPALLVVACLVLAGAIVLGWLWGP